MSDLWMSEEPKNVLYSNLRDSPKCKEARQKIEDLWSEYSSVLDPGFPKSFFHETEERLWELHLLELLVGSQKDFSRKAGKKTGGPDFCVTQGDKQVWIECALANDASEGSGERVGPVPVGGHWIPTDKIELRISNAFIKKSRKYQEYENKKIIGKGDVSLIAINPTFEIAHQADDFGIASPTSVLFPLRSPAVAIDPKTHEVVDHSWPFEPNLRKSTGDFLASYFWREEFNHISGLIWTRAKFGSWSAPERQWCFFHNPHARNPLPEKWAQWAHEWKPLKIGEDTFELVDLSTQTMGE